MKKILFLIITMVIVTAACEDDVFDRQPLDKISDSDVWNNPVMLRSYLVDIYSRSYYNVFSIGQLDTKTEIATYWQGNVNAITLGQMSRTNDPIGYWNYPLIRDVNIFIQRIPDADISAGVRDQLEGEARVLRAMIYFEKMKRYGGVPLVDVPLDPFGEIDNKYTLRSSEEAIFDFIDSDLTAAIALLGENPKPVGQINKWAAYAIKAQVNLWAASIAKYGTVQANGLLGIPSGRANALFAAASAAANEVITSGHYELFDQNADKSENYRLLFITPNNGEEIFTKVYDGVNFSHNYPYMAMPQSLSSGQGARDAYTYDWILLAENIDGSTDQPLLGPDHLYDYMYQAFENKDPRIYGAALFDGDVYEGTVIRTYEAIDPNLVPDPDNVLANYGQLYNGMPQVAEDSRNLPFADKRPWSGILMKKFLKGVGGAPSDVNKMVIRLGEMYLIRAEAEFELGNMIPAAAALNATRARAGISLVTDQTITLDHVRTERMMELVMEHHRWWDLRRWRIAESVLNLRNVFGLRNIWHYESGKIYMVPIEVEPNSRIFLPQHYYNSITDGRINNNIDLVENPDY